MLTKKKKKKPIDCHKKCKGQKKTSISSVFSNLKNENDWVLKMKLAQCKSTSIKSLTLK